MAVSATDVQKAYLAYFGRPADPVGLAYWMTQDAATMKAGFAASVEYATMYAGMSSTERVSQVYTNLLGRAAEPAGLLYWAGELAAGRETVSSLVDSMQANALGDDITTINNRVTYATAFTAAVDTTAEIVGYDGTAAADAARAAVLPVLSTAASLTTAQDALATSVATVTEAGTSTSGSTFALTTGVDTITGGSGNDTITAGDIAGVAVWTTGDSVNGGTGTDTFNVVSSLAIAKPTAATVTAVETMNATSGATVTLDTTGFTGLTSLNTTSVDGSTVTAAATTAVSVTDAATTAGGVDSIAVNGGSSVSVTSTNNILDTIAVGATTAAAGAVTVTSTGGAANANTSGAIAVTGGTTVTVNQYAGNAAATGNDTVGGAIGVTGNASTTAVTVNQTTAATGLTATSTVAGKVGFMAGDITIADVNAASTTAASTIATVTLSNYGDTTIDSGALSTINLSGTGGQVAVTNGALTTPAVTTQALNVNGLSYVNATAGDNAISLDADITTLNLGSTTATSTIANVTAAGVTTLNVTGDALVTLTDNTFGALTTVAVTNTAGVTLGTTALDTDVTFTGGAGADTITIGATTKAITMGAGNDSVTSTGLVGTGGSVNAGDGTDTIVMTSAQAAVADGDATFNTKFTNFEVLSLSDQLAVNTTLDLAGINNVSSVKLALGGAATATSIIDNLVNGGTVTQTGNGTGVTIQVDSALFGAADTLNLVLSKNGILTTGTVVAAGVETLNISTADAVSTGSTAAIHTATITAAAATSIVVTGNNGLNGTYTGSVAVTNFDASGVVANGTADTAANLAVTYVSVNTTAANAVSITGGAGNDTLTGVGNVDTITGGNGIDTITGGAGNDIIILTETTAAADTVVFADAATNGVDAITGFAAGATGADFVSVLAAQTTAGTGAGAGAGVVGSTASATLTVGAAAFALTGASSTASDIVEITTTLSAYGDLGLAGATSGTQLLKALSSTDAAATAITATGAGDEFYLVAYQDGDAYLYQVIDDGGANAVVTAAEISLIGTFSGIAAGAFATGDFTLA